MNQGDVYWYSFKEPDKRRPVLILTRDSVIPYLNSVVVASVTTTIRSIPSEVILTEDDGTCGSPGQHQHRLKSEDGSLHHASVA